jgi:threonine aldolase
VSAARGFASDNAATVHPEVLDAIARANTGHALGYGHDPYSRQVQQRVAAALEADEAFFVFNGTGANVLCLRAACRPWEGAICSAGAHLNTDEGGAPEAIAGVKLLAVAAEHGKLTPQAVREAIVHVGDEHAVAPRLLSLTQSTELGTVYDPDELAALVRCAHEHGLLAHIDGARLANAAATLGCTLAQASAGADLISFGATKNGALACEAVVLRGQPGLAAALPYLRKQSLQLASKMRFLAAQFDALLCDELWRRCAQHANEMAAALAAAVAQIPGVQITHPVQANAVFAILPAAAIAELMAEFDFYVWDERRGEVRWMCSHDTDVEDVQRFAAAVARACATAVPR